MSSITQKKVADIISQDVYLRERLNPQLNDEIYVHLIDLMKFLRFVIPAQTEAVLDYGCGGSPYRTIFQAKRYVRADYVDVEGIELRITEDARLGCKDEEFDVVLSTQVLEHVSNPQAYLREAWRVLKPGGKLILTTHGIWEDHGCPYDFRRWTSEGLRQEILNSGFIVESMMKLTTGPRAIIFMFARFLPHLGVSRRTSFGLIMWLLRVSPFGNNKFRNSWLDKVFSGNSMVSDTETGHGIYIALGCVATKTSSVQRP